MAKFKQGFFTPANPQKYKGNSNNIIYRSSWELHFMKNFLDVNPSVLKWSSEEIAIPYMFLDEKHRYFPDFYMEVKQSDNQVKKFLVEIKAQKDFIQKKPRKYMTEKQTKQYREQALTIAKNQAKWDAAKNFCSINNMEFIVLSEKELGIKKR